MSTFHPTRSNDITRKVLRLDFLKILSRQEESYNICKDRLDTDPNSVWYGCYDSLGNGSLLPMALSLYIQPESRYYKDP